METQEKKKKLKKVIITLEETEKGKKLSIHLKRVGKIEAGALMTWATHKLAEEVKNDPDSSKELVSILLKALTEKCTDSDNIVDEKVKKDK